MKGDVKVKATGWLLMTLGCAIVFVIGKGEFVALTAGLMIVLAGIYVLSLVYPDTRKFMGEGWTAALCRASAVIVGLLMVSSGLMGVIGSIEWYAIIPNQAGISSLSFGLLTLVWGSYILMLGIIGTPA